MSAEAGIQWAVTLTALAGGIAATLAAFKRWVFDPLRNRELEFVHRVLREEIHEVITTLNEVITTLNDVRNEVAYNNGSSLKDAVRRTEISLAEVRGTLGMTPRVAPFAGPAQPHLPHMEEP